MKISKAEALQWFTLLSSLPEDQPLTPRQQEIVWAVLAQLESAAEARRDALAAQIPGLKTLAGRTAFVGDEKKFPRGCKSCLFGTGLGAIRRTNKCNLRCPFCYDFGQLHSQEPVGEGLWEIGGTRFYDRDLDLLFSVDKKPSGVCYVYLEPFMEIELYYPVIRRFHQEGVWQHMYTNGTLCTEENLRALADSGLDELRFNLGATGCSDKVIANIALAAKLLPHVGIETPMTRELFDAFLEKKDAILDTGIEFINFAELHLNENNLQNYADESLYCCRGGYISPMISRELTLRMMAIADREGWPVCVQDCSNMTKFARDLHLRAVEGGWFGASSYGLEFPEIPVEAFLPALSDPEVVFAEEEPLPKGYRPTDPVW